METAIARFMAQQGFQNEEASSRQRHFRALRLQPSVLAFRVVTTILVAALTALIAGKRCIGSCICHILRGCSHIANSTCPWLK